MVSKRFPECSVCLLLTGRFPLYFYDMRQWVVVTFFLFIGLVSIGAGNKTKGFLVTFHLEGEEAETEKFVTPVKLGSEYRQYFFRKMPAFSEKDIWWFYPFIAQDGQSFGAAFRLKDGKAEELSGISVENQGKLLGTRVLDAPLQALVIDQPVNDGVVVIWSGLSQDHLKAINAVIPHVDTLQGQSTPTFELPSAPGSQEGGGKKQFKIFGNPPKKKTEPVDSPSNPFVNPQ